MNTHADILPMIREAFAHHVMTRGPGLSWRMGKPGTSVYSFRVTWCPGSIIVTGDVGDAVYHTGSFGTLWGSIELIHGASWDYLTGKSGARQEFSREATVKHVLDLADEYLHYSEQDRFWQILFKEYDYSGNLDILNEHHRGVIADRFREDDLTAERIYNMFNDSEMPCYEHDPRTRWLYEALQLWTTEMLRTEPHWHRVWRRLQRTARKLKDYRRYPVHFRPELYRAAWGQAYNGTEYWRRHVWPTGRASFRSMHPWKPFGRDLSRFGFWHEGGSSTPDREDTRREFVKVN